VDRPQLPVLVVEVAHGRGADAVRGDLLTGNVHLVHAELVQGREHHQVGALPGFDGAHVVELEVLGRVVGDHLDGGDGIEPEPDGLALVKFGWFYLRIGREFIKKKRNRWRHYAWAYL